ncbi:MAG: tetratricopeptide repeat protein [Planctomycetaceae bacterium]
MAIDTYAPCPGGTGKKIKFCCADLVGDLEQLDTLVEGDQLTAALDQVKRLDEKHPGRPCLLATRVKLELAAKQFAEATATGRRFLEAFPTNPVALGQAAVTEAVSGRVQEAAALFDKAREAAAAVGGAEASARDALQHLVRIAATLVQAAAQTGHTGFAQGLVDWLVDSSLAGPEDLRLLAAIVGSSGVPPALRTRVPLEPLADDPHWRPDFEVALEHARTWRLAKALTGLRSLKGVAGESRPVLTNIAVLCEMLARPVEASEAWLAVSRIRGLDHDEAIEAAGRAIALETEANPDRSPQVRFTSVSAPLAVPAGEEGVTALGLLEDTIRHDPRCEPATFDRSAWVSRGAAPPRSAWRVYEAAVGAEPPRLLASLLVFGRQTDREPELVLQGFAPDVAAARPVVEGLDGCAFASPADIAGMPATTPTAWLMNSQFRMTLPATPPPAPPAAGQPAFADEVLSSQRRALWSRFVGAWPDTELPELLGQTPRRALRDPDGARRVEALVTEGEATSRRRDAADAWTAVRGSLGLAAPAPLSAAKPLEEVPPLRWHRLDMRALDLEQLRGVLVTATDAGFEQAAELAAEALVARPDATPADRWEALGILEDRADSTVKKLEIIGQLRSIAKDLKAGTGTLDVAELRIRLQRGDQAEIARLLERIKRDHGRDPQVLQALAEVLMEAGVDIGALAGRPGGAAGGAAPGAMPGAAAAPEPGKLWTPGGGEPSGPGGEKKVIWTPG